MVGNRVSGLIYIFSILDILKCKISYCLKIIKEWNSELQERTGKFRKQATAIAEWDKRILQNRDVLLRLEVMYGLLRIMIVDTKKKIRVL